MQQDRKEYRGGLISAFIAYGFWGLLPIYFRPLSSIGPFEVLSLRVICSCVLILAIVSMRRELALLAATFRQGRVFAALTTSGLLIGTNWLGYIWAVTHGHVVATSLAYFLNPLINVVLGVVFLRERLRPIQTAAIALAAAGVAILGASAPETLGLSLLLALTFAFYGLVRKLTPVSPIIGLGVETLVLVPPALCGVVWLATHQGLGFGQHADTTILLLCSGFITSTPLLLFATAARRLPMVTLGLIQYVAPTMLLLSAVLLFGEHLSPAKWASFGLVWIGLALFAGHALYSARQAKIVTA